MTSTAWELGNGRLGWLAARELRVLAGPAGEAAAATEAAVEAALLSTAEATVWLVGRTPCALWREWLGAYDVQRDDPLVAGRHVYAQRGYATRLLWYGDGVFWHAGELQLTESYS